MKIGDKVSHRPQTFGDGPMEGEVTYIHPKGRYAMVEFTLDQRKLPPWLRGKKRIVIRECFQLAR